MAQADKIASTKSSHSHNGFAIAIITPLLDLVLLPRNISSFSRIPNLTTKESKT